MKNKNYIFEKELFDKIISISVNLNGFSSDCNIEVKYGNTILICNLIIGKKLNFSDKSKNPLKIFYSERFYSFGKIPKNFFKREENLTKREVFFNKFFNECFKTLSEKHIFLNEILINLILVSYEEEHPPEIPASIALSLFLNLFTNYSSDLFSIVKLGEVEGKYFRNLSLELMEYSDIELTLAATEKEIINIVCFGKEFSPTYLIGAIGYTQTFISGIIDIQKNIISQIKKDYTEIKFENIFEADTIFLNKFFTEKFSDTILNFIDKTLKDDSFSKKINEFIINIIEQVQDEINEPIFIIKKSLYNLFRKFILDLIIKKHCRIDGRQFNEFRKINAESSILPGSHGSVIFKNGNTAIITTLTLGTINQSRFTQNIEGVKRETIINNLFYHSFQKGETFSDNKTPFYDKIFNLYLDKILQKILPSLTSLPYVKRFVYEIISNEGSSFSTALNSANLVLKDSGITSEINFISFDSAYYFNSETSKYILLSNPLNIEEKCSDGTFNMTLSEKGIIALKLTSLKKGVSLNNLEKFLENINENFNFIDTKLKNILPIPKEKLSEKIPKTLVFQVNPANIGYIIGKNGENINSVKISSNCEIFIEGDGVVVVIQKNNQSNLELAKKNILKLANQNQIKNQNTGIKSFFKRFNKNESVNIYDYTVGCIVEAVVYKLVPFGIFVETSFGAKGPVYLSELGDGHCTKPEELVNIGDKIMVEIVEIDGFNYKFSNKKYLEKVKSNEK